MVCRQHGRRSAQGERQVSLGRPRQRGDQTLGKADITDTGLGVGQVSDVSPRDGQ